MTQCCVVAHLRWPVAAHIVGSPLKMAPMTLVAAVVVWLGHLEQAAGQAGDAAAAEVAATSSARGSAIRLGFRKALARRLLELENSGVCALDPEIGEVRRYGEAERAAFEQGYQAAMQDVMVIIGAALAALAFMLLCCSPTLYEKMRSVVQPWAIQQVERGHVWVMRVQAHRHPVLDRVHQLSSLTCGMLFYTTTLPLLFWSGELLLARHVTIFMAMCIYVGNAVKDAICSPRPDWSRGVVLVGSNGQDETGKAYEEYGLPSTHTINTMCLLVYLLHYYNVYGRGDGLWLHQSIRRSGLVLFLVVLTIIWCLFIMHGRLYLGMHSPVDVAGGLVVGFALLLFYIPIEDFADAWMTSASGFVPAYQLVFASLLCWMYPKGLRPTPSYTYAVYFTGVCLGVITGVWRCPCFHGVAATTAVRAARGHPFGLQFIRFLGTRFVVGLSIVFALRAVSKEVLKVAVPRLMDALRIRHSDHEQFYAALATKTGDVGSATPVGYNVLTPIRLLNYAVVGWAVVEPAFDVFALLGI